MTIACDLTILVVGDTRRREFLAARRSLSPLGQVYESPDVPAALDFMRRRPLHPEVIVVAQAIPGQFSGEQIEQLRAHAPLARLVALLGSWCEGEMRTGTPWPAAIRLYWHQWPGPIHRELTALCEGRGLGWSLPMTATEEERLLIEPASDEPLRSGLVVVVSDDYNMADWLSAACRRRGWATVWRRPGEAIRAAGAEAVVFDGDLASDGELMEIGRLGNALPEAWLVVLLAFPRVDDVSRARRAGAGRVLSKPIGVADLWWALEQDVSTARPPTTNPLR